MRLRHVSSLILFRLIKIRNLTGIRYMEITNPPPDYGNGRRVFWENWKMIRGGHKDQRYDEGYKKIGRNKDRLHNRAGEPSRADVMIPVGRSQLFFLFFLLGKSRSQLNYQVISIDWDPLTVNRPRGLPLPVHQESSSSANPFSNYYGC